MKVKKSERGEIQECREKIREILEEYNSVIEYDDELKNIVVVDQDTMNFEHLYF